MAHAVRVSGDLFMRAQARARSLHRSVAGQIEYWAKLGRIAEANPELSFSMIHDILMGLEEVRAGEVSTYEFS